MRIKITQKKNKNIKDNFKIMREKMARKAIIQQCNSDKGRKNKRIETISNQ